MPLWDWMKHTSHVEIGIYEAQRRELGGINSVELAWMCSSLWPIPWNIIHFAGAGTQSTSDKTQPRYILRDELKATMQFRGKGWSPNFNSGSMFDCNAAWVALWRLGCMIECQLDCCTGRQVGNSLACSSTRHVLRKTTIIISHSIVTWTYQIKANENIFQSHCTYILPACSLNMNANGFPTWSANSWLSVLITPYSLKGSFDRFLQILKGEKLFTLARASGLKDSDTIAKTKSNVKRVPPMESSDARTVPKTPPIPGPKTKAAANAAIFKDSAGALFRGDIKSVTYAVQRRINELCPANACMTWSFL